MKGQVLRRFVDAGDKPSLYHMGAKDVTALAILEVY